MKKILFTLFICLTSLGAWTQSEDRSKVLPPDKILLEKFQFIVSNYKMAVILSSNCRNTQYDEESILDMFAIDAKIEVSILGRNEPPRTISRTPKEYFSRLKNLCKGINYDSISIQFLPDILRKDEIKVRSDYTCEIKRDIVQKFVAFKRGQPNPVYCDVTIKLIAVDFLLQRDGSYKALIKSVTVEGTRGCQISDIKETLQ